MATNTNDVFLDTSIQIARQIHGPQTKQAINSRLAKHERVVTSLVVRQEFRRRVLKEAEYLLRLLKRYNSYSEVNQHVIQLFGTWKKTNRKRSICLQTVAQIFGKDDKECTDRLKLFLHSLLVTGLSRFDQMVDEVIGQSGCACGKQRVTEGKAIDNYKLGKDRCSQFRVGECGIKRFLELNAATLSKIQAHFQSVAEESKSSEIKAAENFLSLLTASPPRIEELDPCLTVGDLLIALESADSKNLFTMNSVESQHYCRALGQTLIVQPIDPLKPEIVCDKDASQWPAFGGSQRGEIA